MAWSILRPFTDFFGWNDAKNNYTQVNLRRSYNAASIEVNGVDLPRCGPLSLSVVWAAIRVMSNTVSALPFRLFETTDGGLRQPAKYEGLQNKQNIRLLRRPNPYITQLHFMRGTVVNLALTGNAFALIRRDSQGQWIGTIPLRPDRVRIDYETLRESRGETLLYAVDLPGKSEKLLVSPQNMLHFKMFSEDYLWGLSPVEENKRTICLGEDARDWSGKYMQVGGYGGGLLIFDDFISKDQQQELQAMFPDLRRSSYKDVGKTIVLGGGPKFQALGLSQRDSQFLESREYNDDELARIWGVPLKVMGAGGNDSFYDALQSLMFFGINPYVNSIRDEFQQKIFADTKYEVDFVIQHLLYADPQTRAEYFKSAVGGNNSSGWMSQNEVRAIDNLPPKDFGEDENVYDRLTHFAFTNGVQQGGSDAD